MDKRNLMAGIKAIEIHGLAPQRKRERDGLSAVDAYWKIVRDGYNMGTYVELIRGAQEDCFDLVRFLPRIAVVAGSAGTIESPPGQGGYTPLYNVRFDRGPCIAAN